MSHVFPDKGAAMRAMLAREANPRLKRGRRALFEVKPGPEGTYVLTRLTKEESAAWGSAIPEGYGVEGYKCKCDECFEEKE